MTDTTIRFIHLSDTHLINDPNYRTPYSDYSPLAGYEALVRTIRALPFRADFILHTGDVAYDPVPEVYPWVREMLTQLDLPIYYVAGNHDHQTALQTQLMQRPTEAIQTNLHYNTEIHGVQLIVIDSNGEVAPPRGRIPDEQLAWLDQQLSAADERPLIVATHHNPVRVHNKWLDDFMGIINGDELHRVLLKARYRLRGVFHGHVHQGLEVLQDGILYSTVPAPWCQFHAYPLWDSIETYADRDLQAGFNVVSITTQQTFIRRYGFSI